MNSLKLGPLSNAFSAPGVLELGKHLGPILWQFPPTKKFDEADFASFLELLPNTCDGHHLRHAVEVRHDSFCVPAFVALLRRFAIPVVFSEHERYPAIADVTGEFLYLRLQKGTEEIPTGYPPEAIAAWAKRLRAWAAGHCPADLRTVTPEHIVPKPRDAFVYFIHEGKVHAPAAAAALIARLDA